MSSKIPNYTSLDSRLFFEDPIGYTRNPDTLIQNTSLIDEYNLADIAQKIPGLLKGDNLDDFQVFSQAYAGHQFGGFSILGDGRAHMIKELEHKGLAYDVQLKGSGRTRYSRRGDGRANISSMLREYLMSEAMASLGIPTSRSIGVYTTGEQVYREDDRVGAVLARFAQSHIRIGTFEYVAFLEDPKLLKEFTDYTIARHHSEIADTPDKYVDFIKAVGQKQVELIVNWLRVGFIHGVMNTDNTLISGETLDYGPCAFLNGYHPQKVFSSIDTASRYSYLNQASIISWNMSILIESMMPLLDDNLTAAVEKGRRILEDMQIHLRSSYSTMMHKKVGILKQTESSQELIIELLATMQKQSLDYTNTFVSLEKYLGDMTYSDEIIKSLEPWIKKWKEIISDTEKSIETMSQVNPKIIPRNHLVEKALKEAREGNMDFFHSFSQALSTPYVQASNNLYSQNDPNDSSHQTFCGT